MIIVTGTKRSGTSMWMQILAAAGYSVLGERFPRDWRHTIREANKRGFFESPLRHGVYRAPSPRRRNAELLPPEETRGLAVKVFAPGMLKTELPYIDRAIACVRHFREYEASIERLYAMEHANKLARAARRGRSAEVIPSLAHPPALFEWWHDNFSLLSDARARGYPLRFVSYAAVLRDPRQVVAGVLDWLGGGAVDSAVGAVRGDLCTQRAEQVTRTPKGLSPAHEAVFEAFYRCVDRGEPVGGALWARMEDTQRQLSPAIARAQEQARRERHRARKLARELLRKRPV